MTRGQYIAIYNRAYRRNDRGTIGNDLGRDKLFCALMQTTRADESAKRRSVAPHECRRETKVVSRKGERITVEVRK